MPNNTVDDNLSTPSISEAQARFNLELNDLDRVSGMLFAAALGVLFHQADLTEESILLSQTDATVEENTSLNYTIAKELADMSRINLLAGLIGLYTTTERLKQLEAIFEERQTPSAEERLTGREMITLANTLCVCAFILATNGYELIADGTLKQQMETPPP